MRAFTLVFDNDGLGEPRRIEFTGTEPHHVFSLLEHEPTERRAVLWEGDQQIAVITRLSDDFWQLNPKEISHASPRTA